MANRIQTSLTMLREKLVARDKFLIYVAAMRKFKVGQEVLCQKYEHMDAMFKGTVARVAQEGIEVHFKSGGCDTYPHERIVAIPPFRAGTRIHVSIKKRWIPASYLWPRAGCPDLHVVELTSGARPSCTLDEMRAPLQKEPAQC